MLSGKYSTIWAKSLAPILFSHIFLLIKLHYSWHGTVPASPILRYRSISSMSPSATGNFILQSICILCALVFSWIPSCHVGTGNWILALLTTKLSLQWEREKRERLSLRVKQHQISLEFCYRVEAGLLWNVGITDMHTAQLFVLFRIILYVLSVMLLCMSVYHVHAWCPRNSKEGMDPLEQVIDGCEPPCECWKSIVGFHKSIKCSC